MKIITVLICIKIVWPSTVGANDATPTWRKSCELKAALIYSMPHGYKNQKKGKFGISLRTVMITAKQATCMRLLLLMAGDIESNPGPTTQGTQYHHSNIKLFYISVRIL